MPVELIGKSVGAPPGETDFVSIVSKTQAELAVSPFKNHPKLQITSEQSKTKKADWMHGTAR